MNHETRRTASVSPYNEEYKKIKPLPLQLCVGVVINSVSSLMVITYCIAFYGILVIKSVPLKTVRLLVPGSVHKNNIG